MPRVAVILADGFEEVEAIAVIDVLRRAGIDTVVAGLHGGHIASARNVKVVPDAVIDEVKADEMILDAGPKTVAAINAAFDAAATLVWNGPLGAFELPPFDRATLACARHAATRTTAGKLVTVAGGGDTVAALNAAGVTGDFTYVSSAGGAFLEWLEGRELPGVAALLRRGA